MLNTAPDTTERVPATTLPFSFAQSVYTPGAIAGEHGDFGSDWDRPNDPGHTKVEVTKVVINLTNDRRGQTVRAEVTQVVIDIR